jgi:hypothetical protein
MIGDWRTLDGEPGTQKHRPRGPNATKDSPFVEESRAQRFAVAKLITSP